MFRSLDVAAPPGQLALSMEAGSCIKLGATLSEEGNEQVGTMAGICGTTGRRKCGIKL